MFCPVENQHLSSNGLGRNQVWVLGHIPSPVDFPGMVDLLDNLDAGRRGDGVAPKLAALIIVVPPIELICATGDVIAFGNLHGRYLQVILGLAGGVGAEEEPMGGVGFVCGSGCFKMRDSISVGMKERTIRYRGTIGMLGWANRAHA